MKEMMALTEVVEMLGIRPETIRRWEKAGKVKEAKRDQKGWRMYAQDDADKLMAYYIITSFS